MHTLVLQTLGSTRGVCSWLQCKDKGTGVEVAVKALSLRSLRDWKQLELFEREGQVGGTAGFSSPGVA